jgi:cytochrome c5
MFKFPAGGFVKNVLLVVACAVPMSMILVTGQTGTPTPAPKATTTAPAAATPVSAAPGVAATDPEMATQRAVLDKYCVTCHNQKLKTANLEIDKLDLAHLNEHAEVAEKVIRRLRAGLMPPTGMARPDAAGYAALIAYLEKNVDRSSATYLPPPGLHRMNRTEYTNAIRDVLALEVDASKFLPSDDSTHGFDNIAGALTVSPALMEAYLSAAGKIARLAVGDVNTPTQTVFEAAADTAQNHHIEGLPFGTRGGLLIKYQFPVDGEYTFRVKGVTGYFQAVLGGQKGEQLLVTIDGDTVHKFDWDKEISQTTGTGKATPKIKISAGLHTVGVTFLQTNDIPGSELDRPFERTMNTPGAIPGFIFYPHVGQVWIEGPYNPAGAKETASRKRVFVCTPATPKEEDACASRIASALVKRAYRRPASNADLASLMEFYRAGRGDGSFDRGVEAIVQRVLTDPEFVYRLEAEPASVPTGKTYRVSDLGLASRLSFFLWSSVPDEELINVAATGKLKDPLILEKQVRRMLADPKSQAMVTNFTGQWLSVRSLKSAEPAVNLFPDFDDNLRNAYQREVELFFDSIVHEDRSVVEMLDANYTFVNERLAKQYGIPNIYGPQFRRVTLPPGLEMRRGLLGKGAMLTVTSAAARTSPVTRGKWFLQTFLGVSPPDPPPNVDTTLKTKPAAAGGVAVDPPMRVRMQEHLISRTCATCHQMFEPMGLALENFDATGTWRTHEGSFPIDASGTLVDGSKIQDVNSLRDWALKHSDTFVRVVTEKLMTYALGRGVEYQDMPYVRAIMRDAAPDKYKFVSLVMGIVKSEPFQSNQKIDETAQRASR